MTKLDPNNFGKLAPDDVLAIVAGIRESKEKGKEELALLNELANKAVDYLVHLLLEKAIFYEHGVSEAGKLPLEGMKQLVEKTSKFVHAVEAERWYARIYRFEGRVADRAGDYPKAIECYSKAIEFADQDPEHVEKGVPLELEFQAFLANSTTMSGKVEEGLVLARQAWVDLINREDGQKLKDMSYATWAIWATGIPIRVGRAVGKVQGIDKQETLTWLDEASKLIEKPVETDPLTGPIDFAIRKGEIEEVKKSLELL